MSPAARLRAEAMEHLRVAQEKLALANALDGAAASPAPPSHKADRELDTNQARRIARVGTSTLYRWARRFGIGEKTTSGAWRFSERALRQVLSPEKHGRGENGENGDATRIHMANDQAHVLT